MVRHPKIGRLIRAALLSAAGLYAIGAANAQPNQAFDYGIFDVRMMLMDASTGESTLVAPDELGAYLYDIGPTPRVRFEVVVDRKEEMDSLGIRIDLAMERYILLASRRARVYEGLDPVFPDARFSEPTWVYSGPLDLSYERKVREDTLRFVTEPFVIDFLDPKNPLTGALPEDFSLPGFAYRFLLKSAVLHQKDASPADNAFQLTFMKQ